MAYTAAEIECPGCMGPCGECATYTEQEYRKLELQKMSTKQLGKEAAFVIFQIRRKSTQLAFAQKNGLTLKMIKSDINDLIDELEALDNEAERRYIP